MAKYYRIVFEEFDVPPKLEPDNKENVLIEGEVSAPTNCLDFGICHDEQINLIQKSQDKILALQAKLIGHKQNSCPKCIDGTLKKHGFNTSWFNDVFSDHRVKLPRRRCNKCKHVETNTVQGFLGQPLSGELLKIQSELGANYSYRDSEDLINKFSNKKRRINNHEKIHATSEEVGKSISKLHDIEDEVLLAENANDLIIHVDGGHVKSNEDGVRSFEIMTAAVYNPLSVKTNNKTQEII